MASASHLFMLGVTAISDRINATQESPSYLQTSGGICLRFSSFLDAIGLKGQGYTGQHANVQRFAYVWAVVPSTQTVGLTVWSGLAPYRCWRK